MQNLKIFDAKFLTPWSDINIYFYSRPSLKKPQMEIGLIRRWKGENRKATWYIEAKNSSLMMKRGHTAGEMAKRMNALFAEYRSVYPDAEFEIECLRLTPDRRMPDWLDFVDGRKYYINKNNKISSEKITDY